LIDAIREFINDRWGHLRPGRPRLSSAILAGANKSPSAKVAIIFFDESGAVAAVAKVARTPAGERALRAESAALHRFWSAGAEAVIRHAPEPLALDRIGTRLVFVMSPVSGEPMFTRYHTPGHTSDPGRVAQDFDAARAWLLRFHRDTHVADTRSTSTAFDRWVGSVFQRYRSQIGWSESEERLLEAVTARARELSGCSLPLTGVHGDYWMGNILTRRHTVQGVIDWELSRVSAPPLADVYKFPTSYGFYLDRIYGGSDGSVPGHPERAAHRRRWRRFGDWPNLIGFGYTYFGEGWFPQQARRFILDHLAALGIPAEANAVFFPVFLAEQAMTLDVPEFRNGYRSLLLAFAQEKSSTWLWTNGRG
jgi:aminoglycoside phosphotransferase (APT) family kinase protein